MSIQEPAHKPVRQKGKSRRSAYVDSRVLVRVDELARQWGAHVEGDLVSELRVGVVNLDEPVAEVDDLGL